MRRIRFVLWGLLVACCASCPDAFSRNKKGEDGPRVVFIGDSITDGNWGCVYHYKKTSAERSRTDLNHIYGHTYMSLVATWYETRHPRAGYQFYNRGFSGHKLADLANRWQEDVLDLHPDVLSVLVGVNDIYNYVENGDGAEFDFAAWKELYKSLLLQVRAQNPGVKLVLCTPFVARQGALGEKPDYARREELTKRLAVLVRELAKETGAGLVPFDTLFEKLIRRQPRPSYWIWDGIHPTPAGHRKMAELWLRHVRL